jgi:hypothetical protein
MSPTHHQLMRSRRAAIWAGNIIGAILIPIIAWNCSQSRKSPAASVSVAAPSKGTSE